MLPTKSQTPEFTKEQKKYLNDIWHECFLLGASLEMLQPLSVLVDHDPHSTAAKAKAIVQGGKK